MKKLNIHLSLLVLMSIIVLAKSVPTQLYNDQVFLDAEIRRIRAGKAGDPIKAPVIKGRRDQSDLTETLVAQGPNDDFSDSDEDEEEDDSNYSEEVEVTCAKGKGWHFRGQSCVPYHCPGGSRERDFNTGQCIHSFQATPGGRHKPYSHWNNLNHVYRTHPAQRHVSRGMLALFRRG